MSDDGRAYDSVPKVCEECEDGSCINCSAGMCSDRCPDFVCVHAGSCTLRDESEEQ